jgi:hypothetical protein
LPGRNTGLLFEDSMKKLLNYDYFTKVASYHEYDHRDGTTYIQDEQDVEPILKYCKDLRNDKERKRKMLKGDNHYHYATVPVTVIHEWLLKYGVDASNKEHFPAVDKLLSGPYKYLLTVDKI